MEALELGKGVLDKWCGERRGWSKWWSCGGNCKNRRRRSRLLGHFPGFPGKWLWGWSRR